MKHRERTVRPAHGDYEIARYRPDHKQDILDMQQHLWGRDPQINAAYFAWKYEHNPYLWGTPAIHVALSGGRVVGMRGIFGTRWHAGDPERPLPFMQAGDMVIHPEHRGRGLFRKIVSASIDDLADHGTRYLLSLSAGQTTFLGSLRMGWRCAGGYLLMRRETTRSVLRRFGRRAARTPPLSAVSPLSSRLAWHDPFARLDRGSEDANRRGISIDSAPRPEAMARLVERIGFSNRIQHVRDADFFAWRFRDMRSRFRFIFSGVPELSGYVALRAGIGPNRSVVGIFDWESVSAEGARELLRAAIEYGRFETLRIWSATLSAGKLAALREAGFTACNLRVNDRQGRPVPHFPGLLLHPSRKEPADADWTINGRRLDDIASWDLRMLYSD